MVGGGDLFCLVLTFDPYA